MFDDDLRTSTNSSQPVLVIFKNKTEKIVSLKWLDFSGEKIEFATLLPEQQFPASTFITHPWIFIDAETGDNLSVQVPGGRLPVFEALKFIQRHVNVASIQQLTQMLKGKAQILVRIVENVYPPPSDLRLLAMNVVEEVLEGRSIEAITSLELPKGLEKELVHNLGLDPVP